MVEQSHGLLSTMDLWAKKSTKNCSKEAYVQLQCEIAKLKDEWDVFQATVSEEKTRLETKRIELSDLEQALKNELMWLQNVDRHLLDAADPCFDLSDRDARLEKTKVCA